MDIKTIIAQIDRAINFYESHRTRWEYDDSSDLSGKFDEVQTIVLATIERLAPPKSPYHNHSTLVSQVGALRALRADYADGCMSNVKSLIVAGVFSDFLDMAEHLLDQGYKDPAAVLISGVLEEHLRAMCGTRDIPIVVSGKPKKADMMNADLAKAEAYNLLDQKNVTSWLDLRNKAAHGHYGEYSGEQVKLMLMAVVEFIARVS